MTGAEQPVTKTGRPVPAEPGSAAGKTAFLRMVSHELRTPLNSIIGFSEILTHELYGPIGEPRYKDYAEIIRQSGYKLLGLVNQIVEMVPLQDGLAELQPAAEPLALAVGEAAEAVRADALRRRVAVTIEDGAAMPWAEADRKALHTVLVNLLENAIAFSPEGGEVRVRAERHGRRVEIEVADSGEGLEPADIPRLMLPFEQGENALTRVSHGAGLGLPIARLLCQAMGGSLELESTPGEGVIARIGLPAARMAGARIAATAATA